MKQYPWKFKLCYRGELGIEWYQTELTLGSDWYAYYFKVGMMNKPIRDAYRRLAAEKWFKNIFGIPTVGFNKFWHDGPHAQLNLHFVCFYWSTPWTTYSDDE